jgi:Skp family chaperone for outer membrane proteins
LASPERINSNEQAIAVTMLNIADQWLKTQAEMRRLAATVDDRTRTQSNSDRRFQAQTEEILKLRKALDAAQQKLDAIRDIEKSISERSTSPTGTRESGSRDTPSQTQTPPVSR